VSCPGVGSLIVEWDCDPAVGVGLVGRVQVCQAERDNVPGSV